MPIVSAPTVNIPLVDTPEAAHSDFSLTLTVSEIVGGESRIDYPEDIDDLVENVVSDAGCPAGEPEVVEEGNASVSARLRIILAAGADLDALLTALEISFRKAGFAVQKEDSVGPGGRTAIFHLDTSPIAAG